MWKDKYTTSRTGKPWQTPFHWFMLLECWISDLVTSISPLSGQIRAILHHDLRHRFNAINVQPWYSLEGSRVLGWGCSQGCVLPFEDAVKQTGSRLHQKQNKQMVKGQIRLCHRNMLPGLTMIESELCSSSDDRGSSSVRLAAVPFFQYRGPSGRPYHIFFSMSNICQGFQEYSSIIFNWKMLVQRGTLLGISNLENKQVPQIVVVGQLQYLSNYIPVD